MNNYEDELSSFFDELESEWEIQRSREPNEKATKAQAAYYNYTTGKYVYSPPALSAKEKIMDELETLEMMFANFYDEYADGPYDASQFFRETIYLIKKSHNSIEAIGARVDSLTSSPDAGELSKKIQQIRELENALDQKDRAIEQTKMKCRELQLELVQHAKSLKAQLDAMTHKHQLELQENKEKLEKYERSRKVSGSTRTVVSIPKS